LWDDFVEALGSMENVSILPVYAASESPIVGVDSEALTAALKHRGVQAYYFHDRPSAIKHLSSILTRGDVVVTMGAGDITQLGPELLKQLSPT